MILTNFILYIFDSHWFINVISRPSSIALHSSIQHFFCQCVLINWLCSVYSNENAERVRLKLKSLALIVTCRPLLLTNMFDLTAAITLYNVFKATPPFADRLLRSRNACDLLPSVTIIAFLVLAQTWNICSGKPSPNSVVHRIQIWVVWWSQCYFRLDEWYFRVSYRY